ncbi:HNH homing endonuclease [Escherichia phage nepoznato]|uniref:HNH homing endonuclease n=1 Tax=Escherichia phage nepoznato TaxID=2696431 RepID=A0A6B9WKV8_9CAUD|nr:HNH endonuclease [Escherichia phage nepoznato]QHR65454.1 HNH homing endonuclease [Escherichia phage nepoznato]
MKNLGFIGYPHYCATYDGRIFSLYTQKFLSENKMLGDYKGVTICENGSRIEELQHRLIAKAFVPNPENKPFVNHKDGNKLNNCADNLEWTTEQENTLHAMSTGLRRTEVINDYRPIPDTVAVEICKLLEQGSRNKDICQMYNVAQSVVSDIKAGRTYKDISQDFNFRKIPSSNRISEDKVLGICEKLQENILSINKIAKKYGVSFNVVKSIKDRKTYTYLSNNYNW